MEPGITGRAEETVTFEKTAAAVGSGLLEVYSTPSMIALIESAAHSSVEPFLGEGQGTVGTRLEISHLAPVPVGRKVRAETELTACDGRALTFTVSVYSDVEKIGEGIHKRFIISNDRFLDRMNSKYPE